jgi:ketosteroid isomerase-like protein
MDDARTNPGAAPLARRLEAAMNAHDLEALVDCFADDYRNETPAHPSRGFVGREQVRANWVQILGSVPDLRAVLVRASCDGDREWAEWDWSGTRPDGAAVAMRGVTITGVADGRATWARFYMEPVDDDGIRVDQVVRDTVGAA